MSMYNLLEYSQNYFMTSGSLWNYYRDQLKKKMIGITEATPARPARPDLDQDGNQPPRPA